MNRKHPLIQYIEQRMKETEPPPDPVPGPVITISREYGCPGFSVAETLAKKLGMTPDYLGDDQAWRAVNKDILLEAARDINIPAGTIHKIIHTKPGGLFLDVFNAFSDHYTPGDLEIKRTVAGIVRQLAMDGHSIIVGRAGVVLARDIEKSLHVRIHAPFEYRVKLVSEQENISIDETRKKVLRIDREREYIRNYYSGEIPGEDYFDVSFNSQHLSEESIIDSIFNLAHTSGLLDMQMPQRAGS